MDSPRPVMNEEHPFARFFDDIFKRHKEDPVSKEEPKKDRRTKAELLEELGIMENANKVQRDKVRDANAERDAMKATLSALDQDARNARKEVDRLRIAAEVMIQVKYPDLDEGESTEELRFLRMVANA